MDTVYQLASTASTADALTENERIYQLTLSESFRPL